MLYDVYRDKAPLLLLRSFKVRFRRFRLGIPRAEMADRVSALGYVYGVRCLNRIKGKDLAETGIFCPDHQIDRCSRDGKKAGRL